MVFSNLGYTHALLRYVDDGQQVSLPQRAILDGEVAIALLGLLPATDYEFELELASAEGPPLTQKLAYRTPALASDLAASLRIRTSGADFPGLVLADLRPMPGLQWLVAFDSRGRVRWSYGPRGLGAFFEQLPNGNLATFFGETTGWQPTYGYFEEITPHGEVVARHQAPAPLYTDEHELLFSQADGKWYTHLFTYDHRTLDMTRFGGSPNALIAGHQLLRYTSDGTLDFVWNAWNHLSVDDWIEEPAALRTVGNADFDHPNSLALDRDGHYIVSFRNLAEVTKINSRTGAIIWRFGGNRNQFTMTGDPLGKFCGQHDARILPNGNLLLFDNGWRHDPPQSRAVEYRLDQVARTATMVWEYRDAARTFTPYTGSVQRLADGNTVVGFAWFGKVVEARPDGTVAWEAQVTFDGSPVNVYRMRRIELLDPEAGR